MLGALLAIGVITSTMGAEPTIELTFQLDDPFCPLPKQELQALYLGALPRAQPPEAIEAELEKTTGRIVVLVDGKVKLSSIPRVYGAPQTHVWYGEFTHKCAAPCGKVEVELRAPKIALVWKGTVDPAEGRYLYLSRSKDGSVVLAHQKEPRKYR
jgi:hypothetical protein